MFRFIFIKNYWIIFFLDGVYINDIYYDIFKLSCYLLYIGKKNIFYGESKLSFI